MKLELMTGHLTWWTMGTQTDPVILRESLAEIDLDKYEPNERTWLMSLKSALSDMFQGQYMIRPLDKREVNGYSVVEECKDDVQNDYTTHATARVDDSGGVTVNNFGSFSINLQKLQELTDWYRKTIPGDSVSKILVSILKDELKGISIRDGGCLYFLPEESYDKWVDVCHAVKKAAVGGCVNKTTTHTMERTDETLRDIRDSIIKEINDESATIEADLRSNELGPRAVTNRLNKSIAMTKRLKFFEEITGEVYSVCREKLNGLQLAAAMATAQDETNTVFDGMFD